MTRIAYDYFENIQIGVQIRFPIIFIYVNIHVSCSFDVYVGYVVVEFLDVISITDNDFTSDPSTHVRSRVCISPLL